VGRFTVSNYFIRTSARNSQVDDFFINISSLIKLRCLECNLFKGKLKFLIIISREDLLALDAIL